MAVADSQTFIKSWSSCSVFVSLFYLPVFFYSEEKAYVRQCWKDVRVGDFVRLSCNEIIPADMLLIYSSDPRGVCYIETVNLDGETNLKQKQVVLGLPFQVPVCSGCQKHSCFYCDICALKCNHICRTILGHLEDLYCISLCFQGAEVDLERFHSRIECENPNHDLSRFRGYMWVSS